MFCRHVDFVAVLVITLGLLGFSEAPNLRIPEAVGAIRLQKVAVNTPSCPLAGHILSRLATIVNR